MTKHLHITVWELDKLNSQAGVCIFLFLNSCSIIASGGNTVYNNNENTSHLNVGISKMLVKSSSSSKIQQRNLTWSHKKQKTRISEKEKD